jgi:predicted O-methyltransferase YrrM
VTLSQGRWAAVDDYSDATLLPADPALTAALQAIVDAGLPEISVSPAQGKLLHLLALAQGARRILEIGTLGGYSAIWLARALPAGGRLITLEADPRHAEVARGNLANAGLADVSEVRVGRALDTLPLLHAAGDGPFDLIFIDADKPGYADYLAWSVRLSRPGTMIIADNVVRGGAVADAESRNASVRGVRRFIEALAAESRVTATVIQTVGRKGYDGFALAVVLPG